MRRGRSGARAGWPAVVLCLASCGRYSDFTLPPLKGGEARFTFVFEPTIGPVLRRGAAGEWDSRDALNPSIVRSGGTLLNFYSGFDGRTWRTGLAISPNGAVWTKQGVVLAPDASGWEGSYIGANGSALLERDGFRYWYQAGEKAAPRIALARSADGRAWTREPRPVLAGGPRSSWDERAVGDPYVLRIGARYYLYYLGQDRARRQRLGLARSFDGVRWERLRSNPILQLGEPGAFDEAGLGEPAVWRALGFYWLLYTGRDAAEHRRMGLARSTDGVHWSRQPLVIAGAEAWNAAVVCDPAVEVEGDTVRVWFGGGDRASPDENLNGQIGYGILRATLTE